jgi:hypothetical protein
MSTADKHKPGWWQRRKDAKRAYAGRTGDTPERQREQKSDAAENSPERAQTATITTNVVSGSGGF